MSTQSFTLGKKALAKIVAKVETNAATRQNQKATATARAERQKLEQETEAARLAVERLENERYESECKTVNAIRRKGGATIGLVKTVRVHVPTFNKAMAKLGLDSCDLLAYANKEQRRKSAKLWAQTFADGLNMAYPKASMKRKHPLFMGIV